MATVDFPKDVQATLADPLIGDVYPPRMAPAFSDRDARTHAIKALFGYIGALTFFRRGAASGGPPESFKIPAEQLIVGVPRAVQATAYPSIVALDGEGTFESHGLGPQEVVAAPELGNGIGLQRGDEYTEDLRLEVWGRYKAEVRGICAALDVAMNASAMRSGLLLRLPRYFGQTARFTPKSRRLLGDEDVALGRVRAEYMVDLRVVMVRPVRTMPMRLQVTVTSD